jgi:RHS repeat-associated protein
MRRYVHGPGTDNPVLCIGVAAACTHNADAGEEYYLLTDERGSVIAYVDDQKVVQQKNQYDPFGRGRSDNGGVFQYTGQHYISELDLFYYKARMYHAELGRFMQTDPIGYEDGMNMYAYVGNDPINLIDPSGAFGEGFSWAPWIDFDFGGAQAYSQFEQQIYSQGIYGPSDEISFGPTLGEKALYANMISTAEGYAEGAANGVLYGSMFIGPIDEASLAGASTVKGINTLSSRASQIHSSLDPVVQKMRTTAVVATVEGIDIVASSQKLLAPAQRNSLKALERAAAGTGHAEITAVNTAIEMGLTPIGVGASRSICPTCKMMLDAVGVAY